MSEDAAHILKSLLESYSKLNRTSESLTSCLVLGMLKYAGKDGLQYREFQSSLNITDGRLIAILAKLEELRYIKRQMARLGSREISIYSITEEGKENLKTIVDWMENLVKAAK